MLKLTTASYQRPSGNNIHRFPDAKETDEWGVMPDPNYDMKLSDSEMSDLIRHRRDTRHSHRAAAQAADPAQPPAEKQPGEKQPDKQASADDVKAAEAKAASGSRRALGICRPAIEPRPSTI